MQALIWEVLYTGAFVFMASYWLHYFVYQQDLEDENEEFTKASLESKDKKTHVEKFVSYPLVKKWLDFGGGYYGIVAFVKLIFIEIDQVRSFFSRWEGAEPFIDSLGVNFIVSFFVEQIQNFVAAIIWPTHYLGKFSILECAIFVIVTYLLYDNAKKLAKNRLAQLD